MRSEGDQVETDRKKPGRVVDVWIQVTKRQGRWCYSIVGLDLRFIICKYCDKAQERFSYQFHYR